MKPIQFLAICFLLLTSCQSFYTTDGNGVATITPNQFKLPPAIGMFKRDYIRTFDGQGYNVAAGYNYYSPSQKTALTVFIVSTADSQLPEQQGYFAASRKEVLSAHANSLEIRQTRISGHDSGGSLSEFRYQSVFARAPQQVASFLAVFRDGNRLVKYRITGPMAERDKVYSSLVDAVRVLSESN